jgi:hypothetical protein
VSLNLFQKEKIEATADAQNLLVIGEKKWLSINNHGRIRKYQMFQVS